MSEINESSKIKCYIIEHRSDCSCNSCREDNGYGHQLYFNDDAILRGIELNPRPSQFSDMGSHEVKSLEAELSPDHTSLTIELSGAKLLIPVDDDDLKDYKVMDHDLCAFLGAMASREYTIRSPEITEIIKGKGWSKYV